MQACNFNERKILIVFSAIRAHTSFEKAMQFKATQASVSCPSFNTPLVRTGFVFVYGADVESSQKRKTYIVKCPVNTGP